MPSQWNTQDKKKVSSFNGTLRKNFYWDDLYLFKYCPYQIFRRCIPNNEVSSVIKFYHSKVYGGRFLSKTTTAKLLQCGFYRPTLFKDIHTFYKACENCQRLEAISTEARLPIMKLLLNSWCQNESGSGLGS